VKREVIEMRVDNEDYETDVNRRDPKVNKNLSWFTLLVHVIRVIRARLR